MKYTVFHGKNFPMIVPCSCSKELSVRNCKDKNCGQTFEEAKKELLEHIEWQYTLIKRCDNYNEYKIMVE